MRDDTPPCPYCGGASVLTDSAEVYSGRSYGPIYLCRPCGAYVGCHKGTTKPLGRLANAELREAKKAAHAAFDPIWRGGKMKRSAAYKWLADKLCLPKHETHIGMFDIEQCQRVIEVCRRCLTTNYSK